MRPQKKKELRKRSMAALWRANLTVPLLARSLREPSVQLMPSVCRFPCIKFYCTSSNGSSDKSIDSVNIASGSEEKLEETVASEESNTTEDVIAEDVIASEFKMDRKEAVVGGGGSGEDSEEKFWKKIFDNEMMDKDEDQEFAEEKQWSPEEHGDEEKISLFSDGDMENLKIENSEMDPRDILDKDRTEDDVRKLTSRMADTRLYLQELEKLPIMHIRCTQNNTYIDICDHAGNVLTWKSAGSMGFKNSRRGTTFAAQSTGHAAALKAREFGIKRVRVKLKGLGSGRQHALKGFQLGGLEIMSLQDATPVPHNGCRPKKKRRI